MDPVQRGGPWTRGPCFVLSRTNCRRSSISCLRSDHLEIFSLLLFVSVFCLIQFRLVGLKYSSNDGRTYYAEEIGARSLPNINSVVPVARFRSMSALSPIHAVVILLFLKDWTCCGKHQRKFWERIFASLRASQTPGKIWSESCWQFCIHISSLYNFPDDHALFLFHLSNAWKRFQ